MDYLYVVCAILLSSTTSIFGGFYNRACAGRMSSSKLYNCAQLISVAVCWGILFVLNPEFDSAVLPYSLGFSAGYCVAVFGIINALRTGPVMITTLMTQMSLVVVSLWGFIFWNAPVTPFVIVGLCLTVVAIVLCLSKGKTENAQTVRITPKWIMFALMSFGGNATCSIFQRTQQMVFDGKYREQLMFFATVAGAIVFTLIYLFSDHKDHNFIIKKSYIPFVAGTCNVLMNICVITLATSALPSTMVYLPMSIFPLIIVSLFSLAVFKEKLRTVQWIGVGTGIVSVILLSL